MRIFVYEYLCGGGKAVRSASLDRESWAMLSAALEDFGRLPGVETTTLLDPVLAAKGAAPAGVAVHVPGPGGEDATFRRLAAAGDYTLVIAPEFDGHLEERCRRVENAGGRLLGPGVEAVLLCGDKVALGARWRDHGVPTPVCRPAAEDVPYPAVCKPRNGAGSQATFLIHDDRERREAIRQARAEGWDGDLIVQPFLPGQAASVAFLLGPGRRLPLPPATQDLSADGRFHYRGGRLPLPADLAARATALANRAVAAVDGLRGYVGVDLVLGAAADGGDDAVLEINPRLTTSYVGLRRLARFNLAAALLATATGGEPPALVWGTERIRFCADGTVHAD